MSERTPTGRTRCLIVGQLPEPDLEAVARQAGRDRVDLVVASPGQEALDRGPFDCIWRLFEGGLTGSSGDPLGAALSAHREVRWVHTVSAGIDRLGETMARFPDILLTNSAGVVAIPIAEFVVGCLLQHCKRFPEIWALQREGRWEALALRELGDLKVVMLGLGAIGSEVARRLAPFGCHVTAVRRRPEAGGGGLVADLVASDSLVEACDGADALILAAPLTEQTRGLVSGDVLGALNQGACLVNIARGGLIDQNALLEALRSGPLSAAYLDAFEEEPLPAASPLWAAPGVFLSPHISWSSPNFARRAGELFADQLRRFAAGQPLRNRVDLSAGY